MGSTGQTRGTVCLEDSRRFGGDEEWIESPQGD